jgi:hypothetical protein
MTVPSFAHTEKSIVQLCISPSLFITLAHKSDF